MGLAGFKPLLKAAFRTAKVIEKQKNVLKEAWEIRKKMLITLLDLKTRKSTMKIAVDGAARGRLPSPAA